MRVVAIALLVVVRCREPEVMFTLVAREVGFISAAKRRLSTLDNRDTTSHLLRRAAAQFQQVSNRRDEHERNRLVIDAHLGAWPRDCIRE